MSFLIDVLLNWGGAKNCHVKVRMMKGVVVVSVHGEETQPTEIWKLVVSVSGPFGGTSDSDLSFGACGQELHTTALGYYCFQFCCLFLYSVWVKIKILTAWDFTGAHKLIVCRGPLVERGQHPHMVLITSTEVTVGCTVEAMGREKLEMILPYSRLCVHCHVIFLRYGVVRQESTLLASAEVSKVFQCWRDAHVVFVLQCFSASVALSSFWVTYQCCFSV